MNVLPTHKEGLKSGERCQKIYIFNALKRKSHAEKVSLKKRFLNITHFLKILNVEIYMTIE